MKKKGSILIVDDDEYILISLKMLLEEYFEEVHSVNKTSDIEKLFDSNSFQVVLLDMNFKQGETSGREGLECLGRIKILDSNVSVIMMTAYGELNLAVNAMKQGAMDFIVKPWENERLLAIVNNAFQLSLQSSEIAQLKSRQHVISNVSNSSGELIGNSQTMQHVHKFIEKVAPTDANILLLGENGTGKEVAARAIHKRSLRADEVFISVDLGAISENVFESELFGHTKGAFTDAKADRMGRFEAASGGTIFLDEIGNLPLSLQSKLLTVIQRREVTKIGANTASKVDVRIIAATNGDLTMLVKNGVFREDLYYRINTMEITLPPLRDRAGDLRILFDSFLRTYSKKYQKPFTEVSEKTLKVLEKYSWPGNVRELQHAVERAVIMSDGLELTVSDFNLSHHREQQPDEFDTFNLENIEAWAVKKALAKHSGNVSHAARELGLSRGAMYRRMEKYSLQ
ncbi:sigma-54-dependent Fis family transcriptional regulator [Fulvivirga sp. M361]|uniref:sigma-54-dependent transcriptional regulator n=1 Tax=Fulvivirga sp. M361 TaxID=2594266 RepID=UPI00117998C9|nr:sigma-54 dependent transcriptional regulator [Fulvivirga sp. M361]TRX56270.1 sigma-54-dependent Fis family transcriptional regulator [Fulvivirga sp. M361]